MPSKTGTRRRNTPKLPALVQTALDLSAAKGWNSLSISEIASESKIPLAEALVSFPTKTAILKVFQEHVDTMVINGTESDTATEPVRDRVFDVIMRRLEILNPWKAGLLAIAKDLIRDPGQCLYSVRSVTQSMTLMLECAHVSSTGLCGRLRVHGLSLIYIKTLRHWAEDTGQDLSATMSELDQTLKAAENILKIFDKGEK